MSASDNERDAPMLLGDEEARRMAWTRSLTRKMEALREKCRGYVWLHRENSIYLSDIYEWMSIVSFVTSFFNGLILLVPSTNSIYVRYLNAALSFLAGLTAFYIKNKNLTEDAANHKQASSKYSAIANNIERQLSLPIHLRENGLHYHQWITLQYDTLYGSTPDIDSNIIEDYKTKFAAARKSHPIEAADLDHSSSDNSNLDAPPGNLPPELREKPPEEQSKTTSEEVKKENPDEEAEISEGSTTKKSKADPEISEGSTVKKSKANNTRKRERADRARLVDYELNRFDRNMVVMPVNKCYIDNFGKDEV